MGNKLTYYVDSNTSYQEDKIYGTNCLEPSTFTPSKSGWKFVGWREDKTASGTVLTSKTMGTSGITLYAVFSQDVTVTYFNNTTTAASSTKQRYYNNGNVINPSFTLSQASKSGWTARGWSTGTAGNSGISYNNGAAFTRDSNITLYGMYYQTNTLKCIANGTTTNNNGTRYYNSNGAVVNPSFTVGNPTKSGATFKGWSSSSTSASIAYSSISNVTFSQSTTVYAVFTTGNLTKTYNITSAHTGESFTYTITGVTTSSYSNWTITYTRDQWNAANPWYVSGCGISLDTRDNEGTHTLTGNITSNGTITINMSSGPTGYITITLTGKTSVG
jgi:uncharacterized repeat protein (TIGR02543 family)